MAPEDKEGEPKPSEGKTDRQRAAPRSAAAIYRDVEAKDYSLAADEEERIAKLFPKRT
jgi:hypothetical protein